MKYLTQPNDKYLLRNKNNYHIFCLSLTQFITNYASATNYYIMGRIGLPEILIVLLLALYLRHPILFRSLC